MGVCVCSAVCSGVCVCVCVYSIYLSLKIFSMMSVDHSFIVNYVGAKCNFLCVGVCA